MTELIKQQIIGNQQIIDELNAKLAKKTNEVKIIQQISSEITSTLDLETIYKIILTATEEVLGFKHSMILTRDDSGDILSVVGSRGYPDSGIGAKVIIGQGVMGVAAKRKKILRIGNIGIQKSYLQMVRTKMEETGLSNGLQDVVKLPGLLDVQSQIAIPLTIKNLLIGVLTVESAKPNAFDELDEVLLVILANQVASVINNANLYAKEEKRLTELNMAYTALEKLKFELEDKVRERTGELTRALDEIKIEKQSSMALLLRLAPPEVVPLMMEDKLIARKLTSTILFTDLEGFTRFASVIEPDEIFSRLNYFFTNAGECIKKYRGYINKIMGDSIMALFGVPFENRTHHIDAILSALEMQTEFANFDLKMRVGINTGVITAGVLGPPDKKFYDIIGDSVNVASRMEKICPAGTVVISDYTYKLVDRYFEIEPLNEQEIKGKGLMQSYWVKGIKKLVDDRFRLSPTSLFYTSYKDIINEVVTFKTTRLPMVDFLSIQSRDCALNHNEAVACFALSLLRYLKSHPATCNLPELKEKNGLNEENVLFLSLLHDIGKYEIKPDLLNDPSLDLKGIDLLREEMYSKTVTVLNQLNLGYLTAPLEILYEFEKPKYTCVMENVLVLLVAVADIYDALTAPKIYKGKPWSIKGSLEEIIKTHNCQQQNFFVLQNFVELMQPEKSTITTKSKSQVMFR